MKSECVCVCARVYAFITLPSISAPPVSLSEPFGCSVFLSSNIFHAFFQGCLLSRPLRRCFFPFEAKAYARSTIPALI